MPAPTASRRVRASFTFLICDAGNRSSIDRTEHFIVMGRSAISIGYAARGAIVGVALAVAPVTASAEALLGAPAAPALPPVAPAKPADLAAAPAPTTLKVALDLATIVRVPADTSTLVVGNPLIADGTVQSNGLLIITGKSYGITNLIALDKNGETLQQMMIEVTPRRQQLVVVQRGMQRETYSCTPRCEKTLMLGDDEQYYAGTSAQISTRNGAASTGGVAPAALSAAVPGVPPNPGAQAPVSPPR
jgi:hypothetical protein